ncbi:MAG: exonuclease SbcCD subunit D C-terminal domain-containing protein [Pyramidobacter sp.]|uniref:exonuclease SbcCD subunit D C-terminal domain-containing protein n=1 Tax=Pyramidobacter sp. TaxID=1943581 RepID=UPI002A83D689|nr:exonuclease SbcCD subunit D C-terminal domain-containing protein [Pyramidobacter sp.]MDY4032835.1 exonuclease SbcCD subunit D C-terminal domain-containing protein [Pyramidobacter sp.]
MRILHTSDWHLGRRLCGQERTDEFRQFLDWLTDTLICERADALVVAGDIFDSYTPPLWAQSLYYRFLTGLSRTPCRSAVLVAGNHDSAALLDSPRELLDRLDVHVVGAPAADPGAELFELPDAQGKTGALCCAVPFLRSRDLCGALVGEDADAIARAELDGFAKHYAAVCALAETRRARRNIPIVALGHCFAAGGTMSADDGVRDLAVGSLGAVPPSVFPENVDYLALGHLHAPQICGGLESRRYSGAPLCMGFGEAGQKKQICVVDFDGRAASVRAIDVPVWQEIRRLKGSFEEIAAALSELERSGRSVWVEADCSDEGAQGLNDRVRELSGGAVKILRVRVAGAGPEDAFSGAGDLNEDWSPREVFDLYLREHQIEGEEAASLTGAYLEALDAVRAEATR